MHNKCMGLYGNLSPVFHGHYRFREVFPRTSAVATRPKAFSVAARAELFHNRDGGWCEFSTAIEGNNQYSAVMEASLILKSSCVS